MDGSKDVTKEEFTEAVKTRIWWTRWWTRLWDSPSRRLEPLLFRRV